MALTRRQFFSVLRRIELPALSSRKRDAIKRTQYEAVSRVYLQTRNRFWEERGLNGFAFTQGAIEIWQPTSSQPGPRGILMTYARPGEAERAGRTGSLRRRTSLAVVFVDTGRARVGVAGGEGDPRSAVSGGEGGSFVVGSRSYVWYSDSSNRSSTRMVHPGTAGSASAISPRL